jgi:hypothetical protein
MDEEQDYTSQEIFFGDCNGVFNGETLLDECGVSGKPCLSTIDPEAVANQLP